MITFDSYKYSQNGSIYLRGVNQFVSGELVAQSHAVYDGGRYAVSGSAFNSLDKSSFHSCVSINDIDKYKYSQNGSIYLQGVNQFTNGEFVVQSEALFDGSSFQSSFVNVGKLHDFEGNVVVCTSFHVRVIVLRELLMFMLEL